MKNNLSGFVCVRNGVRLDYNFEMAIESLLPVCAEVIVCDSDSTDGTKEAIERMMDREPKIKYINYPWTNPVRESHHWFIRWLEFAKSHCQCPQYLYLDADEVLDDTPECHAAVGDAVDTFAIGGPEAGCRFFNRLNFWRDPFSLVPDGHCCGKWVCRMGPTHWECVSDEPRHPGERPVLDNATQDRRIKIFHLGFLRKQDAFYAKAKEVLNIWFGRYDTRLENAEREGKPVWESECDFADKLVPYQGSFPPAVKQWLFERGHLV